MRQINIAPGSLILAGNKRLEVVKEISPNKIEAKEVLTGATVFLSPGEVDGEFNGCSSMEADNPAQTKKALLEEVSEADMQLASKRFEILSTLGGQTTTSRKEIGRCASMLGISISQVYRLIAQMDLRVGAASLLPRRRGRAKGVRLIEAQTEDIIQETIDRYWSGPGVTAKFIIGKIEERCSEASIRPPSAATISSRIKERRPRDLLRKKAGEKIARQAFEVRGGKVQPEAPLELVQIDHALIDCIIVDSERRLPLIRPWVTMAIDVYTRVVLGFYLSLAAPSAMSVALCISHSALPKDRWLKTYGFTGDEYAFYGMPKRIHVDNGKEFKSKNLSDSCRWYDVALTFRPKRVPHNGAHIERLIGTFMGKVHFLPGATLASVKDKGDYKSEKHAALSFPEFREWFIREAEIYHKTLHTAIGCSPLYKWERAFRRKDGSFSHPPIIDDQLRLLIDFMPLKKRVIGRAGVRLHNIDYYSSTLKRFDIGTRCTVRYDPESLRKIWVLPEGERNYIELGYADLRLPNTSLSEFKRLRKSLKGESERRVPAEEVFGLIKKNELLVSTAVAKSKQARKARERKRIRLSDPGHPLNEELLHQGHSESVDYSVKPVAYKVED
ncbi:Mu transposase C-terminal domain-containing protein [Pseudomonas aeruginosa]|uniref:Mu transposase C-terminal domain-containing protein n=1 Tax=Pseudomonas aeruginosa TaxID=287 RepID=UPI0029CA48E2|nr:Mu transposase C-terminal domain-containing protein [Pseudomonas aeruginosa]HEJ3346680.1 transposase [Pseudomonas aeruginosa]